MRKLHSLGLAAALAFGAPMVAQAQQTAAEDADRDVRTTVDRDDDGGDWGWIGIFGLAGLLGLKRREPDVVRRDTSMPSR
jgi:hypothetical protein